MTDESQNQMGRLPGNQRKSRNEEAILLIETLSPDGKLTLVLDPDAPGQKATKEIIQRLIIKLYIKVTGLEAEPDSSSGEKIKEMLGG